MEEHKLLKELAEGYSIQAKLSNQYWLLLILISIAAISNTPDKDGYINLPLGLGVVNQIDFNSFVVISICVLSLAYASAFLQASRTRLLIEKVIENTEKDKLFIQGVHIQDIFDSIVTPTFNRVAPIAQFLQGQNQFFEENAPKKRNRFIGILVYITFKIITGVIIFGIPVSTLCRSIVLFCDNNQGIAWGLPIFFYWVSIVSSFVVFAILIFSDIKYMFKVIKRIRKATK